MTAPTVRDDFSPATLRALAQQAGYLCSHPNCRQLTIGPSEDRKSGVTMVGVGAHISAASAGGPRFNPALTRDERANEANGIWLCQLHAKFIDDNPGKYTAEDLLRWKVQHLEWVFARIQSADNSLKHGITRVTIKNAGPFRREVSIPLGRHNIVFGFNDTGKSTLCEAIAAFSGGVNFEKFCYRWELFGPRSTNTTIAAAVSVDGMRKTVRLGEEPIALKRTPKYHQTRLHVEVDGNISAGWPQSLFNVVYLDSQTLRRGRVRDHFRRDLQALAPQLGMTEDRIWDALREELFCSSVFGSRIRRTGEYRAEVMPAGGQHYHPTGGLAGSERTFAILDIVLRMTRADPRQTPWTIIVDSSVFMGLDSGNQARLVDGLNGLNEPIVQTIVCVNSESSALKLKTKHSDRWSGSRVAGALTIHSFL
jgi:hypothetical protein